MLLSRRNLNCGVAAGIGSSLIYPSFSLAQAGETVMERVKRTREFRYGAVNAQPPYSYKDPKTGEWTGFMIDLANGLARELGVKATPVDSHWGTSVLDIQSGKVDVFFGLGETEERAKVVGFLRPLFINAFSLIAQKSFNKTTWKELDDPSVRVTFETGSIYDININKLCPNATHIKLKSNNDAMLAIQAKRADCQVIAIILALTNLMRNPGIGHIIIPEPQFTYPSAGLIPKESDTAWRDVVNAWIDRRRSAGQIKELLVDNLIRMGIKSSDLPPQMTF